MYIYTLSRIWFFGTEKAETEIVNRPAYTNFKECKKDLLNFFTNYTIKSYFSVNEIENGEYNRKELLSKKHYRCILGYAIYDLVNTYDGKHETTRYMINRYRIIDGNTSDYDGQ